MTARRRAALALLALSLPLGGTPAGAQVEADPIVPTFQLDRKRDVRGPLDIVRVAMSTRIDGTLRGEVTMRRAWETADVGPGGSVCLKLYVEAQPDAEPPEYLVCATPPAQGDELVGRVLRNRLNGLPRTVAEARLERPTARTLYLHFEPSAIRRPDTLEFAAESLWRGERCPRPVGCVDAGPDAPDTRSFRLRRNA